MIETIKHDLEQRYITKPKRLAHIYGVRKQALSLGRQYHCDLQKLEIAALLHDITKYYTKEQNIKLIQEHYPNSEEILSGYNEHIYHGFTAAIVAQQTYHIKDKDIINSIAYHTVGKPNMSIYEKIIFISDYTEENRTYESCIKVRKLLEESIDLAVYTAIDDSIRFYEAKEDDIPQDAYNARTYYKQILEEQS